MSRYYVNLLSVVAMVSAVFMAAGVAAELEAESCDPHTGQCGGAPGQQYPPPPGGGPPDVFLTDDDDMKEKNMANFRGRNEKDMEMYGNVLDRFEALVNTWCCAAIGAPLYGVSGDKDVMNYIHYLLSHTLLRAGQQYGSQLVIHYHMNRNLSVMDCGGIEFGDQAHLNAATLALLQYKEDLVSWLNHNEVNPDDIIEPYIPQVRETFGQFTRSRLLFGVEKEKPSAEHRERVIDAILPIVEGTLAAEEFCSAGGEIHAVTQDLPAGSRVRRAVDSMLESCFTHGKLAEDPTEFGNALRISGREEQARELYHIAVTRGKLCNIWQRPESHHRKDITARAVWSMDDFPVLKKSLARERLVPAIVGRLDALKEAFPFSQDHQTMSPFMKQGWFERTIVFAAGQRNTTVCDALGKAVCDSVERVINDVVESNDAYTVMCNGSQVVELWRFGPNSESVSTTGQANIVLQYVVQLAGSQEVVWQLGEEALLMDNTNSDGTNDAYVLDDTFENLVKVGVSSKPGEADAPAVLFHIQLCHPDLHEKAVETPSKVCA